MHLDRLIKHQCRLRAAAAAASSTPIIAYPKFLPFLSERGSVYCLEEVSQDRYWKRACVNFPRPDLQVVGRPVFANEERGSQEPFCLVSGLKESAFNPPSA